MPHLGPSILALLVLPSVATAQVTLRTVAAQDDPAPGQTGMFRKPVPHGIDATGRVLLRGPINNNGVEHAAYWIDIDQGLQLVAAEGDAAPGGGTFETFLTSDFVFLPHLSPWIVFWGVVGGQSSLWVRDAGTLRRFVTTGDTVGGQALGPVANFVAMNEAAQTLVSDTDGALFLVEPDGTGVRLLDHASFLGGAMPQLSASGHVAAAGADGLYHGTSAGLTAIVQPGQGGDGLNANETWIAAGSFALGPDGYIVFAGGAQDDQGNGRDGIWTKSANGVVTHDLTLPATFGNVVIEQIESIDVAAPSVFLLRATTSAPTPIAGGALIVHNAGAKNVAVATGQVAPGTNGAVFESVKVAQMNSARQILFTATITGTGVDTTNNEGVWLLDPGSEAQLLVRKGDMYDLGGGRGQVMLASVGSADNLGEGHARAINDSGEIVLRIGYPHDATVGTAVLASTTVASPQESPDLVIKERFLLETAANELRAHLTITNVGPGASTHAVLQGSSTTGPSSFECDDLFPADEANRCVVGRIEPGDEVQIAVTLKFAAGVDAYRLEVISTEQVDLDPTNNGITVRYPSFDDEGCCSGAPAHSVPTALTTLVLLLRRRRARRQPDSPRC